MNEPNNLLRIDRLQLRNFRCFAECSLELHPTLTLLVADNSQGKTALLDALRIALNVFVATVARAKQCSGFEGTDIRLAVGPQGLMQPQLPTEFSVLGEVDRERIDWRRVLSSDSFHARSSTKDTAALRLVAQRLADRPDVLGNVSVESPTVLPVVAFYGTGRLYDEHRLTKGKRWLASTDPVRVSAYLDCLSPSSSYKSFAAWFGQKWDQVSDPRFRAVGFEARPENHITAVRDAVRTVLEPTGWTTVYWEPPDEDDDGRRYGSGYLALEHSDKGKLPLSHLSDGVRNMVALVGDLAHRCVRLNPHFGEDAARLTPGIVLIDEVAMHLHPRWQQLVVGLLQRVFPKLQMVLTTHSPQVVTTVNQENIRILGQDSNGLWQAETPPKQTKGVESAVALNDVMKVNPVPPVDEANWLADYTAMIETGSHDTEAGRDLRAKLVTFYSAQHPVILDCDRLIRFQAFKAHKEQQPQR